MEKSKLGISVGLLAALLYFLGLLSGYLVTVLVAGYILVAESNLWLRKSAVKAVLFLVIFSLLGILVNLIPNFMNLIYHLVAVFGGHFYLSAISELASAAGIVINFLEKVVFIGMGIAALMQKPFKIPVLDPLLDKYMN